MVQTHQCNAKESLVWCLAIKFTDMEKNHCGTANWQSDHYLTFTSYKNVIDSYDVTQLWYVKQRKSANVTRVSNIHNIMSQPAKEVQKAMDEHASCIEVGWVQAKETGLFSRRMTRHTRAILVLWLMSCQNLRCHYLKEPEAKNG